MQLKNEKNSIASQFVVLHICLLPGNRAVTQMMIALHFNQIRKQDIPRTMLNSHHEILQTLSGSITPS